MKTKKFTRKLRLSKETVTNLDNDAMVAVQGGATLLCTITQCAPICQTLLRYTQCIDCVQ